MTKPGDGDDFYQVNGAGEMLVFSAADFEDFLEPRPDMQPVMESGAESRGPPSRGESLAVPPACHLRRDHLARSERLRGGEPGGSVRRPALVFRPLRDDLGSQHRAREGLGGGIAVQDRMAFQGEYFVDRYGAEQAKRTPPIRRMLEMGVPVGAGTDATRVSSYNPCLSLYWLITGKTIGGLRLYQEENRLDRTEALRLYTVGSSWFSAKTGKKGALAPGQLADLAVLSADYFSVPEEEIKHLESVLTIVGGKVVYASDEFSKLAPPALPVSPDWSPVKRYGGYAKALDHTLGVSHPAACSHIAASSDGRTRSHLQVLGEFGLWGLGCDCFAF